ncbi:unnamed protein product [Dibothriocephalus latus]|uniref:Uncharacterized protein n=1 Tax=Dibothriocephalus latus TaxID=60516 RepID=A0A3P7NT95_DIBLA|nr:unnamed protein product [Dibothriocephalus latus]
MTRPIEAVFQTADGQMGTPPRLIEQSQPPDCLVLLQIATAGSQGADLGSDEMPPVLITAKLLDVQEKSLSGPEFQVLVRLRRNRISREVSEDYPDLTDDPSEDGYWPPVGETSVKNSSSGAAANATSMDISTECESPFRQLSEDCQAFTGLSASRMRPQARQTQLAPELRRELKGTDPSNFCHGLRMLRRVLFGFSYAISVRCTRATVKTCFL